MVSIIVVAACGSAEKPQAVDQNASAAAPPAPAASDGPELRRKVIDHRDGKDAVWIEPGRESGIDRDDPCCGLWYDGNQYSDRIASCAPIGADECADDLWSVRPGIADDPICGTRRRCVPLPQIRVIGPRGAWTVEDLAGTELAAAPDEARARYQPAHATREGAFVRVSRAATIELIAVDYGARYTIRLSENAIERVTRDVAR